MFEIEKALRIVQIIVALSQLALYSAASAGDWPQILGPRRNGHSVAEKLANDWSEHKPARRWSMDIGEGYAGPAVVGKLVLIFHREGASEILACVSAQEGKQLWSATWAASYRGGINSDRGPRCVPLVHRDRVFVFGAGGDLHCVALADGDKLWSRKLGREYKAQDGYFGFGSSPIVVGDRLMVNVGGKAASIVAVDLDSGKTVWKKFDDQASYSAPTSWTTNSGLLAAIFVTRLNLVGVRPSDGEILFRLPFGARGPTVNAATPLAIGDDRIFVTASYRIGAMCLSLKNFAETEVIWETDDVLSSQYPTPVFHNGHLYGVHGRDDGPAASLRCIDATTGKVKWSKDGVGMAHLIVVDGKLLSLRKSGELALLKLSSDKYDELGVIQVSDSTIRAHPALSNGRLYVRNAEQLTAWQLPK